MLYFLKKYQALSIAALCFISGSIILLPGSDVDSLFSPKRYLGVLLLFFFYVIAAASWGRLVCKYFLRTELNCAYDLNFGGMLLSLAVNALLAIGFAGPHYRIIYTYVFFGGIVLAEYLNANSLRFTNWKMPKELVFYFLLVVIVLRTLQALQPWSQSDPMLYHLFAPRLWFENRGIVYHPQFTYELQSRYWEYLYLAAMEFCSGEIGRGLIETQLLAQLVHVALGYLTTALLLNLFFKKLVTIEANWRYLCIAACLLVMEFNWISATAKNDWGMVAWTLSGILFLPFLSEEICWQNSIIAGIALGFAFAAKFNACLAITCFYFASMLYSYSSGKFPWKHYVMIPIISILAAAPILLRNWILTKNPFYPELSQLTTYAGMSKSMIELQNSIYSISMRESKGKWILECMKDLIFDRRGFGLLIIPFLFLKTDRLKKVRYVTIAIFMTTLAWAYIQAHGELRYMGLSVVIVPGIVLISLGQIMEHFSNKIRSTALVIGILLVIYHSDLLPTTHSGLDIYRDPPLLSSPIDLFALPNAAIQIRTRHLGGSAKAWIRTNVSNSMETVLDTGDFQFYYMPGINIVNDQEDPEIDEAVRKAKNLQELTPLFEKRRIKFIIATKYFRFTPTKLFNLCLNAIQKYPETLAFQSVDSFILDVKTLRPLSSDLIPPEPNSHK